MEPSTGGGNSGQMLGAISGLSSREGLCCGVRHERKCKLALDAKDSRACTITHTYVETVESIIHDTPHGHVPQNVPVGVLHVFTQPYTCYSVSGVGVEGERGRS